MKSSHLNSRRLNPVSDEHELRVIDTDLVALQATHCDVVIVPFEIHPAMRRLKAPGPRHVRLDADDVERLLPLSVRETRLVAEPLELGGEIEPGELIPPCGRSAALERIGRQKPDGCLQRIAGNERFRGLFDASGDRGTVCTLSERGGGGNRTAKACEYVQKSEQQRPADTRNRLD